jgi:monomeric sarcosine oxidase
LTPVELRRRFPAFQFGDEMVAVLERDAGFLYVEECVRQYAQQARQLGAALRIDEAVLSWEATARGVVVQTTKGNTFAADRLIITAGAWAGVVLARLGLPLTVLRKVLLWFGASDPSALRRDVLPVYMAESGGGLYYGFPIIDGRGHKVARHDGGCEVESPALVDRTVTDADAADCRAFLRAHVPAADGRHRDGHVCMYTVTPDRHFIIDRHPEHPQVIVAAGFSGHGFKFASVVGEVLADLADTGKTDLPVGMFRIDRLRGR